MPRSARKQAPSQIYHVMLRGINRQQIFYDAEDYQYFISLLDRFKGPCEYEIYAYCLMGNHVHLLIHVNEVPLGKIFQHISTAFVYWYNIKYERTGHLFQDRFKSEAVDSQQYLLTVFRYILQNPTKAGLCSRPEDYRYSSAREYLCNAVGITDVNFFQEIIKFQELKDFLRQENNDQCMDVEDTIRIGKTDEAARALILKELGTLSPGVGKAKERESLNQGIRRLVGEGISTRQLSRLTGISRKIIRYAVEEI